jgi:hypothetical protein
MKQRKKQGKAPSATAAKRPWQKMELRYLGDAAQLIQMGGGKLSTVGGDPGENRKQSGPAG